MVGTGTMVAIDVEAGVETDVETDVDVVATITTTTVVEIIDAEATGVFKQ